MLPTNYLYDPAAYGSVPNAPSAASTAGTTTPQAISAGNQVYQQLPGYLGSLTNIGQNIQSETAGQLPQDVITQMQQQAAERGIATGTQGSQSNNAAYLRALGLNSLQLTNTGQSNLENILPKLPGASIASNPSFYLTPGEQYESGLQQSIFAAAPNPMASALAKLQAGSAGLAAGRGGVSAPAAYQPPGQSDMDIYRQNQSDYGPNPGPVGAIGGGTSYNGNIYYGGSTPTGSDAWASGVDSNLAAITNRYASTVSGDEGGQWDPSTGLWTPASGEIGDYQTQPAVGSGMVDVGAGADVADLGSDISF